jgi:hypothetical protein
MLYAFSLVEFDKYCASRVLRRHVIVVLGWYVVSLAIYSLFAWSGYGRLILGAYLMLPVAIASHYGHLNLRPLYIYPALFLATVVATISRFGTYDGAESVTKDSGARHLAIMSDLAGQDYVAHEGAIWDQFLLLVFNWVPRAIWPDKPLGLGYSFVDDYLGRTGFGDDYSVSMGLVGEHLYLNREYWFLSFLLTLAVIVSLRAAIRYAAKTSAAPVVGFDITLISLLWGGMATFGSRVWILVIPMLFYLYVTRLLSRSFRYPVAHLRQSIR